MANHIDRWVARLVRMYESVRLAPQRRLFYEKALVEIEADEMHLRPLALQKRKG